MTDFGLAKNEKATWIKSATGAHGTIMYDSPERVEDPESATEKFIDK